MLDLSEEINYDPPNMKSLDLSSEVDPTTRATYAANWNAMLGMDITELGPQRKAIDEAWEEWITK